MSRRLTTSRTSTGRLRSRLCGGSSVLGLGSARDDSRRGLSPLGGQQFDDVGRPRLGRLLVEAVDVDAIGQPGRTKRLESFVEQLARMAEQVVGDVPERQHRETEVLESLRLTADRFPEQGGVVGELAVAEGRRDRDEVRGRLQVGDVDLVELDGLGFDADGFECLGERHRRVLGVAHIGAKADDQ